MNEPVKKTQQMVLIQHLGKATCEMSGKEAEGVSCKFANGTFEGFLSWQSFKQMCRFFSTRTQKEPAQTS